MIISATLLTTLACGSRSDRGLLQARIAKLRSGRRLASQDSLGAFTTLSPSRAAATSASALRAHARRRRLATVSTKEFKTAITQIFKKFKGSDAWRWAGATSNRAKGINTTHTEFDGKKILEKIQTLEKSKNNYEKFTYNVMEFLVKKLVLNLPSSPTAPEMGWQFSDHQFDDKSKNDTIKIVIRCVMTSKGIRYSVHEGTTQYKSFGGKSLFTAAEVAANLAMELRVKYRDDVTLFGCPK